MKKIVRLTESDLTRIVKRVVKESADEQKKQLAKQNFTECFDEKLYPNLAKLGTVDKILIFVYNYMNPISGTMMLSKEEKKEMAALVDCLLG